MHILTGRRALAIATGSRTRTVNCTVPVRSVLGSRTRGGQTKGSPAPGHLHAGTRSLLSHEINESNSTGVKAARGGAPATAKEPWIRKNTTASLGTVSTTEAGTITRKCH